MEEENLPHDFQYYSQNNAVVTGRPSVMLVHLLDSLNRRLFLLLKSLFSSIVQPKQSKIHTHSNHCNFLPPKSVVSMTTTMTSLTTRATVLCEMQSALSMVIWIPIGIQIHIKVPCDRGHVQSLSCTGGLSWCAGRGSYAWSCVHGEDPLPEIPL